jgi:hypothetical protein
MRGAFIENWVRRVTGTSIKKENSPTLVVKEGAMGNLSMERKPLSSTIS